MGLDYANQRFYASTYGRFNTPDPENGGQIANPITMNLYNYTHGDPVNLNDPTGLDVNIPIQPTGGSLTSCLNQSITTFAEQNGIQMGSNFGNLANTPVGNLAVTLLLEEDQFGTLSLYTDMAQVMVNRYQLQYSNPSLDGKLGLPTGSFSSIVQATSQVWNNGNLTTKQDTTLTE
jgi:RHS repeat-associated protein